MKKCWRVMCLGPTHSVSMSVPGPCTPSRYEPNVYIFARTVDGVDESG